MRLTADSERLGVGFPLHADVEFLELVRPIVEEDADFFEIAPETTWRPEGGQLVRNGFHRHFEEIVARTGKPVVGHGLAFSLATPLAGDEARTDAWLARLRDDFDTFQFEWLSDHLGFSNAGGRWATLPLPLPYTDETVAAVAARMRRLAEVVPTVAFENNVAYFALSDPRDEPRFLNSIVEAADCRLVLDLHNAWTQCRNLGTDADAYVAGLDLARVIEIHVSGGSDSEPSWLPSRRTFRLDSHDGPVPEPVWTLLEKTLPRCRGVRGLVVERMNGSVTADDLPALRDEVRRAKELWKAAMALPCS
jgi:uncharacterized protein